MNKYLNFICTLLLLVACNGSGDGGDKNAEVTGLWSGQLYQASGLNCLGAKTKVGVGVPLYVASLNFLTEGFEGSPISIVDDTCTYQGVFTNTTSIELVPNSDECNDLLVLTFLNDETAEVFFQGRNPKTNECSVDVEGTVLKQ